MATKNLEARVAALERLVQQLIERNGSSERTKDWRALLTLPPPPNIQVQKEIDALGRAFRERDRRAARRRTRRRRTAS